MKMPLDGTELPTTEEAPLLPQFETAFVVMLQSDGSWRVQSDLAQPFAVERVITRTEVRQACLQIADAIHQQDTVNLIVSALSQNSSEDSQRVSASVRDALSRRKED